MIRIGIRSCNLQKSVRYSTNSRLVEVVDIGCAFDGNVGIAIKIGNGYSRDEYPGGDGGGKWTRDVGNEDGNLSGKVWIKVSKNF